ncbi:MAG: hypothetical protein PHX62_06715, partial [Bacilli bacterium]|nr:hypothetical protein [Bacilli bacterium]
SYLADLNQLALLSYGFVLFNQDTRKDLYAAADTVQYVRKATKIVRVNPRDIVDNPDAIQMEDNTVNEYYLDQNQKIFKKSLVDLLGNKDMSFEDALRSSMTQTMDITNSLFKSVFESKQDLIDEFSSLKPRDLEKDLEEVKQRSSVAKVIRETKEYDFRKSIELEKEQMQELSNIQSEIIKSKSLKRKLVKDKKNRPSVNDEEKRAAAAEDLRNKKIVIQTIHDLSSIRKELFEQQKELTDKLIKETDKELIAAEKERAKIERQEELERLRQERKEKLAAQRAYFKEQTQIIREKYKQMREMILASEKANRESEMEKLRQEFEKRREEKLQELHKEHAI